MKKFKLIIAIVLLSVIFTTIFAGCNSEQFEIAPVDVDASLGERALEYLKIFAGEDLKNRTLGTQGELDSALYIANIMTGLGYEGVYSSESGQGLQEFKTTFKRFDGQEVNDAIAHNVIFTKKSASQKSKGEIILACQYDNLYSEKLDVSGTLWNADGSYESGTSMAVLLTLAETLKDLPSEYDLTFAFFTGGCYGWKGAMNYVDNLDRAHLDKIQLVLNFAMLGGGDNWYIYSGESKTQYGKYLNDCSNGKVTDVPKDKNVGDFIISEDAIYNYSNIGMLSNQYFFDIKGLPTANFLSLNWEINDNPLFTEMQGKDNIYHTKNDTLTNMLSRKGENNVKAQIFEVISATLTALDSSNQKTFDRCLESAREELTKPSTQSGKSATLASIIVKVVLIALLIAISYLVKNYLTKNIDKYRKIKEAKESNGEDINEIKEPFDFGDTQTDIEDVQNQQNSEKKSKNDDQIDPFA